MARRTMNEIENDYKRIRSTVDTAPVTSIKEIAKAVGLSESEVKTSLARHPRIEKKIIAKLKENKEALKAKKKAKNEAEAKNKLESEKKAEEVTHETVQQKEDDASGMGFVIDASITGSEGLIDTLLKICATNAKIILTSVTIKELDKMKKFQDTQARDARRILAMAVKNRKNFHTVLIDETTGEPDDCIVKYCADNKDKVTLLTSDNGMVLKARMYGVQIQYFKQNYSTHSNTTQPNTYLRKTKTTLFTAKKVGHKLIITDFNTDCRSILVMSNGFEYTHGEYELKIGDDVYLATKKSKYMTFAHYRITSLNAENNCKLIYSKRIYKESQILNLPIKSYKVFMRDFKRRHDL